MLNLSFNFLQEVYVSVAKVITFFRHSVSNFLCH